MKEEIGREDAVVVTIRYRHCNRCDVSYGTWRTTSEERQDGEHYVMLLMFTTFGQIMRDEHVVI